MTAGPSRDARQGRALLAGATVLAVLVAVIALTDASEPDDEPGTRTWAPPAAAIPAAEVEQLTLRLADGATLAASRDGDGWRCVADAPFPCEARAVDELVGALGRLELGSPLEGAHVRFGLERPQAVVTVAGAGGQSLTLSVGDAAPVGSSTYLLDEAGQVRPSRMPLHTALPATAHAWRSAALTAAGRTTITGITVVERLVDAETAQPTLALEKDERGWWATAPGGPRHRAATREVSALIDTLGFVRADAFDLAPPASPAPLALVLHTAAGDETLSFWPGEGAWLAHSPLQDGHVRVSPDELPRLLDRSPAAWLSDEIMPVHGITLESVRAVLAGTELAATRTEGGWSDPRTEALLQALDVARAERSPTAALPAPVGDPWGSIRLDEGGRRVEEVHIHQLLDDGARVAVDAAGGPPFRIGAPSLQALAQALGGPPAAP